LTILARSNKLAAVTDAESGHIIVVALELVVFLLSTVKVGLATTEVLLLLIFVVVDDSESSGGVHGVSVSVVEAVLSGFFTPVSKNPIDFKVLSWSCLVGLRMCLGLLDGSEPWLDRGKFISFTGRHFFK